MARARNIKPGFFKNYLLADLGPCCQILFAGLWCLADREGRLEDKPRLIKAELFPYYDFDVNGGLTELERCNFVKRYKCNGESFIQVVNFKKHQSPHGTEKASSIPEHDGSESQNHCSATTPENHGCLTVDSPNNNDGNRPDSLIPDSLIPDSLIPDSGFTDTHPADDAPRRSASIRIADLINLGISQQIASDFLAIRKAKRAPLTTTALDGIQREAEKAGITLQQALTTCIERGWQGYKAEWDKREGQGIANTTNPPKSCHSGSQERYAEQPLDYPLAEPDKDIYTGPVDVKAAMDSIAAMRANLKLDEEAF